MFNSLVYKKIPKKNKNNLYPNEVHTNSFGYIPFQLVHIIFLMQ